MSAKTLPPTGVTCMDFFSAHLGMRTLERFSHATDRTGQRRKVKVEVIDGQFLPIGSLRPIRCRPYAVKSANERGAEQRPAAGTAFFESACGFFHHYLLARHERLQLYFSNISLRMAWLPYLQRSRINPDRPAPVPNPRQGRSPVLIRLAIMHLPPITAACAPPSVFLAPVRRAQSEDRLSQEVRFGSRRR